tara:strand:- start:375 stop:623 length:249 start_codon:yes stop_codon:yes gene_type:complete
MQYNEADLDGHLENGNGPSTENERLAEALISAEEVLVNDYPLNEALNVLKGINAFKPAKAINTTGAFAQSNVNQTSLGRSLH